MPVELQSGAQDQVAVYGAALAASNWKTRWQAAQALGELKDSQSIRPLVAALDDSNQWVRIVAAEALGQIRDQVATVPLIHALDDNSVWVRRASVVALGQIGDDQAISPLMERLLCPPDNEWPEELRDTIAKSLGNIGGSALQDLINALENSDLWVSSAAARALGQIGATEAIVPLTVLTKQKQRWVRSAATQALAQIADERAVRAALTTDEAPRAFWKLKALKAIDDSTISQLTALLQDPDEEIRARAAEVLSQLGDEQDTARLTASFGARSPAPKKGTRDRIPIATQKPGAATTERPAVPQDKPAPEAAASIKPLLTALQDPVAEVRLAAAEALGQVGDASIVTDLSQSLQDQDSRVRAAAARSLGKVGTRSCP